MRFPGHIDAASALGFDVSDGAKPLEFGGLCFKMDLVVRSRSSGETLAAADQGSCEAPTTFFRLGRQPGRGALVAAGRRYSAAASSLARDCSSRSWNFV
jgi:hypothetical protein